MKKQFRLLKNWDFQKILNNSKQVINAEYVIYYKKNNFEHLRIGVTASKKLGNAVKRVKLRRQIRSIAQKANIIQYNVDVVVILRKQFLINNYDKNHKSFLKLVDTVLKKAKITKECNNSSTQANEK